MKPIVDVMPLWDDEKESIWMLPGYMEGIEEAGAIPIIFPFSADETEPDQLVRLCSGILFTGGPDISPDLYSQKIFHAFTGSLRQHPGNRLVHGAVSNQNGSEGGKSYV